MGTRAGEVAQGVGEATGGVGEPLTAQRIRRLIQALVGEPEGFAGSDFYEMLASAAASALEADDGSDLNVAEDLQVVYEEARSAMDAADANRRAA